ncbi:MAG: two-component regulator propeller domain-containing protein [Bacteroidota bacterium]|nr:two-component regulator propeller domain-containing protein [Bacteroidota bacterium]
MLGLFVKKTQAQTYPFSNFTVENGLSQGQILSVYQDKDGVMWFGTNGGGIIKYDGHNYEYLTDKDGLADNFVYCIVKDKTGNLLIGTSNGLSVYYPNNISTKKFKNYSTKNGLGNNLIFTIIFDRNNDALLGTSRGISKFADTTCSALKFDKKLDTSSVFHLFYDSKENLWCSTLGNGVFNYTGTETKNYTTENGIQNNMVFGVLERSENVYWFLTGEGLSEFYHEKIKHVNPPKVDSAATYYNYYMDKNNALWLGTSNGLIKCYDNNFYAFKKQNGLVDNSIWKIMQDREFNLWFVSDQNGISKLASERFYCLTTKDGLLQDAIKRVYQDKKGSYWIGTKTGLNVISDNKLITYKNTDLNGSSDINTITQDANGNYLIGTSNGLTIYNGKSFQRIVCKDQASQYNCIYDIYNDKAGNIWLGTPIGVAQLINGYIEPFEKFSVTKNYIFKIFEDKNKNLWFGTEDGLFMYDGKKVKHFTEKDGFTQKRITGIIEDNKNNLWFSTLSGLYKYQNTKFLNITVKQGLAANEVLSLIQDKDGTIWAGFSTGIDKLRLIGNDEYSIRHYGIDNGFLGQECSQNCMLINNAGGLVIGTSKGLMFYQKQFDKENHLEPITKLINIDLFFQKTDWHNYADSVDNRNIPFNLELPYDKNYLTFNFIGVSLTTPKKVLYKYMLKGIDKDWRLSEKTEVSYSNIPPGKYEFVIYANNGEGVWNKEPLVFKFKISPPFWRTWWFYSIVLLIILSGVYSYFKIRTANKKILKQNEIIEEKNGALQHANLEIAEKNQNITDSINYAKRIQQSFLTSEKILNETLKDYFILFKPRDIVSGDFYLAFDLPDRIIVACSDCTGHGIPGAFMSLIGISLLNEIIYSKNILDTDKILEELRTIIIKGLNPEKNEAGGKDGMDISLVSIFKETTNNSLKINFSGGNNSMYLVSSKADAINMKEYKGDKQPVGYYSNMKPFTQQEIIAEKGDTIYLFTDGYADQFGGDKGKKFMSKQLKQKLSLICHLPLNEQKKQLDESLMFWQGKLEQVDDVTVIGIKLA